MNDNQSFQQLVNKTVTLEGKTADAKSGAVLVVNGNLIFIEGLEYWPQNLIDKQVTLSGKLVFIGYIPKAETDENGLMNQGGSGNNEYVLQNAAIKMDKEGLEFKPITDTANFQ